VYERKIIRAIRGVNQRDELRGPIVAMRAFLTILAVESNLAAVYGRIRFTIKLSIPMNQIILGIIYMRLIWCTYVPVKYYSGIYRLGSTGEP